MTLGYLGTKDLFEKDDKFGLDKLKQRGASQIWEKCRTVLQIAFTDTDEEVTNTLRSEKQFAIKRLILQLLIPHVNLFLNKYRAITLDQMAYEISAWDVPVWHFRINKEPSYTISTYDYLSWNELPSLMDADGVKPFYLLDNPGRSWNEAQDLKRKPYEMELLDAYNSKVRGDYKSALRKAVTAFEICLDERIIKSLITQGKSRAEAEAEVSETISWNKKKKLFYNAQSKSLAEYLSNGLLKVVEDGRRKRHRVVHNGEPIIHKDHGTIRMYIDHMRFAINTLEDDKKYGAERDRLLLRSSLEILDFFDQ